MMSSLLTLFIIFWFRKKICFWQYIHNIFLTRIHSSRMHTARSSSRLPLGADPPDQAPPWEQTPPAARHAGIAHPPPRGQNSWHTLLKILPCPKLRLRAVKIHSYNHHIWQNIFRRTHCILRETQELYKGCQKRSSNSCLLSKYWGMRLKLWQSFSSSKPSNYRTIPDESSISFPFS